MLEVLSFTILQASLSAIGAVVFGCILSAYLVRNSWGALESFSMLPFFLPPLSVILGVVIIYGRSGFGLDVYGLLGILICHWVLNVPLVARIMINAYRNRTEQEVKLATLYGRVFSLIDWVVWVENARYAGLLVFLYATLSFTIVLTLGGGPESSTIELSIYSALKNSFDLVLVVKLASLQFLLGIVIVSCAHPWKAGEQATMLSDLQIPYPSRSFKFFGTLIAWGIIGFVMSPLIVLFWKAKGFFSSRIIIDLEAWQGSIYLASMTLVIAHVLSFVLFRMNKERWVWVLGSISPLVLAVGLILFMRPFANPFDYGLEIVSLLQAITLLPLAITLWQVALSRMSAEEVMLSKLYADTKFKRFKVMWYPNLKGPFIEISAVLFVLSLGDLALLPLLSPPEFQSIPKLIWTYMGSYRIHQAQYLVIQLLAVIAIVLTLVSAHRKWEARRYA